MDDKVTSPNASYQSLEDDCDCDCDCLYEMVFGFFFEFFS